MAEVSLSIHGHSYSIACDDGQEKRVSELGKYVDARLRDIAAAGAASNESHLLVLTALVLADEIYDLRESVENLSSQHPEMQAAGITEEEERIIAEAINQLTHRLDSVSSRLQKIS